MVGLSCFFDFSDGLLARALKVNSEIGKQLDSLADMVSFGVVPGVLMYMLLEICFIRLFCTRYSMSINEALAIAVESRNNSGISYLAFLIPVLSAIRLAKFNLDTRQTNSFIGLPTPANTIFISSLALILSRDSTPQTIKEIILHPYFLITLSVISSFLLIAPLPLFALKFKNFSWADNKVRYIFLALAATLLIIFRFAGIPLIIVLYIVLSIINNIISRSKTQQ